MRIKFSPIVIGLVALGSIASAHAQGTNQYGGQGGGYRGGYYNGGSAYNGYAGAGVPTGRGPMSQPIPPAVSSTNRGQNVQQSPYRSQNNWGPTLTNPPQHPFGGQ